MGHALAQSTFLEKGSLQLPELSVEKEVAHPDQTDDDIPGDRRVGVLDAPAERRVGRVREPVQVAKTERIGVLRGPLLKTAHSQEIAVIGQQLFETGTGQFRFRPGPLFADIVLADEINRAPAKTQSALLEAMQENQVSIDGVTHALSGILTVLATQNPIEYEGTYPLPEAQLDRFMIKVVVDYPALDAERLMIRRMHQLGEKVTHPESVIRPVINTAELIAIRAAANRVDVDDSIVNYIVEITRNSRSLANLSLGASPRAGVMLLRAAKALAVLHGKSYVTPDEVREVAMPVLRHRIRLTPEAEIEGLTADTCIDSLMRQVAVPR